jgi:hypothetical protein
MDGTRARRTRDRIRQAWHARSRQQRFARFLGFARDAGEPNGDSGGAAREALSRAARIVLRDRSNSIRGFAELLVEDPSLTTRSRRFVMNILTSVNQLLIDLDGEQSHRRSDRVASKGVV